MFFIKLFQSIIGFLMVILFIRLFLRTSIYHDPLLNILYRVTDPLIKPLLDFVPSIPRAIILLISALLIIRGIITTLVTHIGFIPGQIESVLTFSLLLYKIYLVVFIMIYFCQTGYGNIFQIATNIIAPVSRIGARFKLSHSNEKWASLIIIISGYCLLTFLLLNLKIMATGNIVFNQGMTLRVSILLTLLGITSLFGFFMILIIINALMSWISPDPYNPIVQAVHALSEPVLRPFQRIIPNLGGIDFSPLLAIFVLQLGKSFLEQFIYKILGSGLNL